MGEGEQDKNKQTNNKTQDIIFAFSSWSWTLLQSYSWDPEGYV